MDAALERECRVILLRMTALTHRHLVHRAAPSITLTSCVRLATSP
jgi:hypothetical protein